MIPNLEEGSGYSAFALFTALRLHFTSKAYNYFQYHGKTNVSKDSFMRNKTRHSYYKLSRKYDLEQLEKYYVANFVDRDVNWIGDVNGTDGELTYVKWKSRNERLTYQFEQDIIHLFEKYEPKDILSVVDDHYPRLLVETMQGGVMIETLAIMNDIMNFFPMWDKKISDDVIWPNWKMKVERYTPFIEYDKVKFKNIMKEQMHEYC